MLKESIRMSWQNIRGNKMRTFLTMLGIIIGVTAIIALITTVGSATGEITSQFSALGAGKVSVSISGTAIKHGLNESDLAHIAALDNVAGVDPNVSLRTYAAQDGQLVEDVTLEGRSNDYFSVQDDLIGRGRALKAIDMDRSSHVCIIDQTLASAAFPNEDPLGQALILHGQQFTVVGVLSEDSGNDLMAAMSASSDGGKAIIPYPAAMRLSGSNTVRSLTLYLKDSSLSSETVDNVTPLLGRAVISQPDLVILDEPNTYSAKRFEAKLYELLEDINRRCAIILVSHDIGTILQTVKTIACVNETLDYHPDTEVPVEWIDKHFGCPIDLLGHGNLPHRVLKSHCCHADDSSRE